MDAALRELVAAVSAPNPDARLVASLLAPLRAWEPDPQLRDRVLFSLALVLSPSQASRFRGAAEERALEALERVLACTGVASSAGEFRQVWRLLEPRLAAPETDSHATSPVTEEVALPALRTARRALAECPQHAREVLGREVRLGAVECVGSLFGCCAGDAGALAAFLPGVSSALCKVATGDFKQGSKVVSAAVRQWSRVVCVCLDPASPAEAPLQGQQGQQEQQEQRAGEQAVPAVVRDEAWLKATLERVLAMARMIFGVERGPQLADKAAVRAALVEASAGLLAACPPLRSHALCHQLLVDCLVLHSHDDDAQVAQQASAALDRLSLLPAGDAEPRDGGVDVAERLARAVEGRLSAGEGSALDLRFRELLAELPRVFVQRRGLADDKRLRAVRLACGYARILSRSMRGLLVGAVPDLMPSLLMMLELVVFEISAPPQREQNKGAQRAQQQRESLRDFAEELSAPLMDLVSMPCKYPARTFAHFRDERVEAAIRDLFRQMCDAGGLEVLADYLASALMDRGVSRLRREASSLYVLGAVSPEVPAFRSLTESLVAEGLGNLAESMGPSFQSLLPTCLYPMLELLGGPEFSVTQSAWLTLTRVAVVCGYKTAQELVSANADYIIDTVNQKMLQFVEYPRAPFIFRAVLQYTGEAFLPLLEDTLDSVIRAMEANHSSFTEVFLRILNGIASVLFSSLPREQSPCDTGDGQQPESVAAIVESARSRNRRMEESQDLKGLTPEQRAEHVRNFFLNRAKKAAAEEEEPEPLEKAPTVYSLKVTHMKKVLDQCVHYLGSASAKNRLLALDTVVKGIIVMKREGADKTAADGQVLLWPLVHSLWDPLMRRTGDPEKAVCLKAVNVIATVCDECSAFIAGRVMESVMPKLFARVAQLLSGETAKFTWEHKERVVLLRCLATVVSRSG
eukprot:m51a1_g1086 hypothetical protein (919) ;mRNA; r:43294-46857